MRLVSSSSASGRGAGTARRFSNGTRLSRRYTLRINRYITFGVTFVAVVMAAVYTVQPELRHFFWPAIAWTIFLMSAMVALVVVGNILVVLYYMFMGYPPEVDRDLQEVSADVRWKTLPFKPSSRPDKPGRAAQSVVEKCNT